MARLCSTPELRSHLNFVSYDNADYMIRTRDPLITDQMLCQIDVKTSIGKTGFEPATPWSQTKYSTKLSYFPLYASGRIRTYNRLIRSQVLYPVEPRLQITLYK